MESSNMNFSSNSKYDLNLSKSKSIPSPANPNFTPVDNEEYTLPRGKFIRIIIQENCLVNFTSLHHVRFNLILFKN